MQGPRNSLRPQDILIALKLRQFEDVASWNQLLIAKQLGISPSEVVISLERLKKHHLINKDKKSVKRAALVEFLIHGLKYVFPAELGAQARGIPTGAAVALKGAIRVPDDRMLVWPDSDGKVRGHSIVPLYKSASFASKDDPFFYNLLALIDVIRVGSAREFALAKQKIEILILGSETT